MEAGGGSWANGSPTLLLFTIFIMCSCSFALVSEFFSQSSCRMSCWVRGRVTANRRNCCRRRGLGGAVWFRPQCP